MSWDLLYSVNLDWKMLETELCSSNMLYSNAQITHQNCHHVGIWDLLLQPGDPSPVVHPTIGSVAQYNYLAPWLWCFWLCSLRVFKAPVQVMTLPDQDRCQGAALQVKQTLCEGCSRHLYTAFVAAVDLEVVPVGGVQAQESSTRRPITRIHDCAEYITESLCLLSASMCQHPAVLQYQQCFSYLLAARFSTPLNRLQLDLPVDAGKVAPLLQDSLQICDMLLNSSCARLFTVSNIGCRHCSWSQVKSHVPNRHEAVCILWNLIIFIRCTKCLSA